eukprot:1159720-Pelagomonas_calceolata.AAC.14
MQHTGLACMILTPQHPDQALQRPLSRSVPTRCTGVLQEPAPSLIPRTPTPDLPLQQLPQHPLQLMPVAASVPLGVRVRACVLPVMLVAVGVGLAQHRQQGPSLRLLPQLRLLLHVRQRSTYEPCPSDRLRQGGACGPTTVAIHTAATGAAVVQGRCSLCVGRCAGVRHGLQGLCCEALEGGLEEGLQVGQEQRGLSIGEACHLALEGGLKEGLWVEQGNDLRIDVAWSYSGVVLPVRW